MAWTEQTLAALKDGGRRNGKARRAIVELLGEQDCCLTAEEIFDRLRTGEHRVGIASVYRVLDQLTDQGLLQRVELGGSATRYEPAHADGEHHHHIVCDNCGKVDAFTDAELEGVLHEVEGRTGYSVAGHDVVLHGTCGDCSS